MSSSLLFGVGLSICWGIPIASAGTEAQCLQLLDATSFASTINAISASPGKDFTPRSQDERRKSARAATRRLSRRPKQDSRIKGTRAAVGANRQQTGLSGRLPPISEEGEEGVEVGSGASVAAPSSPAETEAEFKERKKSKADAIMALLQTPDFKKHCQGNVFIGLNRQGQLNRAKVEQLVNFIEANKTQITPNKYFKSVEFFRNPPVTYPVDMQRISQPVNGGPEELVIYPCQQPFGAGGFKNVSLAFDYHTLNLKVKLEFKPKNVLEKTQLVQEADVAKQFHGQRGLAKAFDIPKTGIQKQIWTQDYYMNDLFHMIQQWTKKPPSETDYLRMSQDLLAGLAYMHEQQLVHQDIKPENILIEPKGNATYQLVLSDFGVSEKVGSTQGDAGTYLYFPPEVASASSGLNKHTVNAATPRDMWALGLSLWEMKNPRFELHKKLIEGQNGNNNDLQKQSLNKIQSLKALPQVDSLLGTNCAQIQSPPSGVQVWLQKCQSGQKPSIDPNVLQTLNAVICTMLIPDPNCRITAAEAFAAITNICQKQNLNKDCEKMSIQDH